MSEKESGISVKGIVPYLFILPILVGVGVFGFTCFVYIFKLSFTETDLLASHFIGFKNYIHIFFEDKWFFVSLWHTFYYVVWTVPLNLIIGLGLALAMYKKIKYSSFFRFTYLLPWVASPIIIALIFRYIFNPEWGVVNWLLGLFGIDKIRWTEHYSVAIPVVAIMGAWQSMGFGMIIFLGAMNSIPNEIFEAAELEGPTQLQKFLYITLPLLRPTIFFYLVVTMIGAFQVFDAIYSFAGTGEYQGYTIFSSSPILVSSFYIYLTAFQLFTFGRASAIAITVFWIVLLIVLIQRHFIGKKIVMF